MRHFVAFVCAVVGGAISLAHATTVVRPDGVRIYQGDWTFVPVVSITDGSTVDVIGALALRDPGLTYGDNLATVWYENPHVAGEKWPAMTWTTQNQWDAVKWLRTEYGIDEEWNFMWPIAADPSADPTVVVPVGYDNGLLEGDPLADIGDPETHDDIVKILVAAGYTAASVPADKDGPCDSAAVLPALEDLVTINLLFDPTLEELQDALATMIDAGCATGGLAAWHPAPPPATTAPGTYVPRPALPGWPVADPHSFTGWPSVPVCVTTTVPAACVCSWDENWYNCPTCPAPPPGAPGAIRPHFVVTCPMTTCTGPIPTAPGSPPGCTAPTPTRWWY